MRNRKESLKFYRGYLCKWEPSSHAGHWLIYDTSKNFMGSADENELDSMIDELSSEG